MQETLQILPAEREQGALPVHVAICPTPAHLAKTIRARAAGQADQKIFRHIGLTVSQTNTAARHIPPPGRQSLITRAAGAGLKIGALGQIADR